MYQNLLKNHLQLAECVVIKVTPNSLTRQKFAIQLRLLPTTFDGKWSSALPFKRDIAGNLEKVAVKSVLFGFMSNLR